MRKPPSAKPQKLTPAVLRRQPLPELESGGGKESRGRVLIIAGGMEMPGAAILAGQAALRAGAGKVRIAVPAAAAATVGAAVPESYVVAVENGRRRRQSIRAVLESARQASAVLIGPGLLDVDLIEELLPALLKLDDLPALVLDAFALPMAPRKMRGDRSVGPTVILTPHRGEMALLTGASEEELARAPAEVLRAAVASLSSVIALKGAETYISAPGEAVYLNDHGHPGLGTAGSGDVLAGLLAGLCARGAAPLPAALWAVWLHASAGCALARRIGPVGFLAREIADAIPGEMRRYQRKAA